MRDQVARRHGDTDRRGDRCRERPAADQVERRDVLRGAAR